MSARVAAAVLLVAASAASATGCRDKPAPPPPAPIVIQTAVTTAAPPAAAAPESSPGDAAAAYLRAHYTKFEYRVPMRDGVRLFTSVYVPNDAAPSRRYPFLLMRTPYGVEPYGADRYPRRVGPSPAFEQAGYIFVDQDVRGRNMSEGDFVDVRPQAAPGATGAAAIDESTDTFDTISWLLAHVDHHNGKVGQWGISYPGFYTWAGALSRHPALVAVSPQAPVMDWWQGDDMHRNGAFNLQEAFTFFAAFGRPRPAPVAAEGSAAWPTIAFGTPDHYRFFLEAGPIGQLDAADLGAEVPFWKDLAAHPDYDAWWQARDLRRHLKDVRAAVLVVGGWYDTENLFGALESYQAVKRQSTRTRASLLMGPWSHGAWSRTEGEALGDIGFGFKTSEVFRTLMLAFFEHHLRGKPAPDLPAALVFETGANRWRRFDAWPPRQTRVETLYLDGGGVIRRADPGGQPAADEFVSDPARPVPYTLGVGTRSWSASYVVEDQRPFSRRPDVLTYESAPLDADLTLAGPLEVELFVSTTGTDADWVVKLVDVNPGAMPGVDAADIGAPTLDGRANPGGRETLVRGEPFRGRYREAGDRPLPFTPDAVTPIRFTVDDVFHTFQRGHRLQIQIQSSWFPFIDRNPQTFVPSIWQAKPSDFVKATHRIHRGPGQASAIRVRVLPSADQ